MLAGTTKNIAATQESATRKHEVSTIGHAMYKAKPLS
jgi:hypothetical protein